MTVERKYILQISSITGSFSEMAEEAEATRKLKVAGW